MRPYCVKALGNTNSIPCVLFLVQTHFYSGKTAKHLPAMDFRVIFVLFTLAGCRRMPIGIPRRRSMTLQPCRPFSIWGRVSRIPMACIPESRSDSTCRYRTATIFKRMSAAAFYEKSTGFWVGAFPVFEKPPRLALKIAGEPPAPWRFWIGGSQPSHKKLWTIHKIVILFAICRIMACFFFPEWI